MLIKTSVIFDFLLLFKTYIMVSEVAFDIKDAPRDDVRENSFYCHFMRLFFFFNASFLDCLQKCFRSDF